ncbi:hypothetical protein BLNAU_24796 [Blattamonas nauphoetae]|uniref:Uncharacterized protein n=1 Tax=Blattamonas nauphoetae TaxID=2049346 RepID=A0ABQ9WQI1_9EUKA|nr:hypothetical protein BLNAU_24796 [Blattamonas nauphoetae]
MSKSTIISLTMHEYNDYFYTSTFGHFPYPLVTATDPYTLERIDTEDPRAKTSKITDVVSWRCLNDCPPHDQTLLEWFVQGVIALDSWLSLMKRPNLLEREDVLLDDTGTIQLRRDPQRPLPPRARIFTENLQSLCVLFPELHQTWLYPYP